MSTDAEGLVFHTTVVDSAYSGTDLMTLQRYPSAHDTHGEQRPHFVPTIALSSTFPVGVVAAAAIGSLLLAALVALGTAACILLAGLMIRAPRAGPTRTGPMPTGQRKPTRPTPTVATAPRTPTGGTIVRTDPGHPAGLADPHHEQGRHDDAHRPRIPVPLDHSVQPLRSPTPRGR
ncbi:hypothetical protein ACWEJS_07995 [Rhodococcus triatomae]